MVWVWFLGDSMIRHICWQSSHTILLTLTKFKIAKRSNKSWIFCNLVVKLFKLLTEFIEYLFAHQLCMKIPNKTNKIIGHFKICSYI